MQSYVAPILGLNRQMKTFWANRLPSVCRYVVKVLNNFKLFFNSNIIDVP